MQERHCWQLWAVNKHTVLHCLGACRWQGVKPRGGPAGDPSVVLVQLETADRQLQDLQEEAQLLAEVIDSARRLHHTWAQIG